MARLAHQQKPRLPDVPIRKPTQNKENPFDDSEDEEQEHGLQPDGGAEGVAPVDPMVTAIGKLTQIAAQLATQKKTRKRWKTFWTGLGQLQAQSPGAVQAHVAMQLP